MNITIKDIAKKLGVSYSSVSRAMNGKEGVSEDTRRSIIELANQLGYQPNDLARGLVNKVSNTVGVIILDINNPFYGEIVTGITEAAKEKNYNVFLCISDYSLENEKQYFDTLIKKRVDGIILKSMGDVKELYDHSNIPLMVIERYEEPRIHSSVEVDNVLGGYTATRHLLDCGYRKTAFILGKDESTTSQLRLAGARKAILEAGFPFHEDLMIYGSFSIEGGRKAAKTLIESGADIDSFFCMNDLIALGVIQYCSEVNLKVPEDIGVIGYDNISYAGLPQIQLTTVHQPKHEMGRLLFETLLQNIQDKENQEPIHISLTPDLIVRKTTKKI